MSHMSQEHGELAAGISEEDGDVLTAEELEEAEVCCQAPCFVCLFPAVSLKKLDPEMCAAHRVLS